MKIAILGAAGFVGTRVVEYLALSAKAEVRAIVRRYAGLARLSRFDGIDACIADATNEEELFRAFQGCEIVLHSINTNDQDLVRCPASAYRAAERAGVRRIIFISSASIYGNAQAAEVNESTPIVREGLASYAVAKFQAEQEFLRLGSNGGVDLVVLRPSIIIGPRSGWVSNPARQLLSGQALLCEGGPGICNTVYVDNLIEAIMLAVHSERAGGQVFVIGDNEVVTWAEYYRRLGQLLEVSADGISSFPLPSNRKSWGRGQFEYLRETPYFKAIALLTPTSLKRKVKALLNEPALKTMPQFPQPNAPAVALDIAALHLTKWRLSTAKARNVLGYQGKISLQEGLQRSVSWLRFAGWI